MEKLTALKTSRDLLLKLHKAMLDREREFYQVIHGPLNSTQFLSLLLEDEEFAWLRKFSMLIVEIDEMFAQKDGYDAAMVDANLVKIRELVTMSEPDEYFRAKYKHWIQQDLEAEQLHQQLTRTVMTDY